MAGLHDHDQDYHRGEMEIAEQVSTFELVMNITKWGSLLMAAAVLFLVVWFMPEGGFFGGAFAAGVLLVLGWLALRKKPGAH